MRLKVRSTACARRPDQQRLGQPGHASQQAVAAGKEDEQHLVYHLVLPDEHTAQLVLQPTYQVGTMLELERCGGRCRKGLNR